MSTTFSRPSFPQKESNQRKNILDPKTKILDLTSWEIKALVEKEGVTNAQFIPYHCKAVRVLGPAKYCQLADLARKGNNKLTLMSHFLKEELRREG